MPPILIACRLAIALASASFLLPSENPTLGGFICVPPPIPGCVDAIARDAPAARVAICQRELEAFAASTITYRECLEQQISAAMLRANGALDRFRCNTKREACDRVGKAP